MSSVSSRMPASGAGTPTQLGPYLVSGVLGRGGAGIVLSARLPSSRKDTIAIKVLREEAAYSPRERRRFLEEAAKMRRVEHPSIVSVLEVGETEAGEPYIAMPLLRGETLAARLDRGPLSVSAALSYLAPLADAVSTLHAIGLIHRDIKPENIILESGTDRPVLLDFGIARDAEATESTTETGTVRGSPAYMAPERFFGIPASVATDTYELAVVFYMMITGTLPWRTGSGGAGRLHPIDPREQRTSGPNGPLEDAMVTVLLRALSTRPEVRPAGARALAEELTNACSASPAARPTTTLSFRPSPPQTPAPGARPRARWLTVVAGLAVVATAVGAVVTTSRWGRSPEALAPASEPRAATTPAPVVPSGAPDGTGAPAFEAPPSEPQAHRPTRSKARAATSSARAPVRRGEEDGDALYRDRK